jgi:hypothetical protein
VAFSCWRTLFTQTSSVYGGFGSQAKNTVKKTGICHQWKQKLKNLQDEQEKMGDGSHRRNLFTFMFTLHSLIIVRRWALSPR